MHRVLVFVAWLLLCSGPVFVFGLAGYVFFNGGVESAREHDVRGPVDVLLDHAPYCAAHMRKGSTQATLFELRPGMCTTRDVRSAR